MTWKIAVCQCSLQTERGAMKYSFFLSLGVCFNICYPLDLYAHLGRDVI